MAKFGRVRMTVFGQSGNLLLAAFGAKYTRYAREIYGNLWKFRRSDSKANFASIASKFLSVSPSVARLISPMAGFE